MPKPEAEKKMQKIGEVCANCKPIWDQRQKDPKILVKAPGTTMLHKMIVPVCPYCDGDLMFEHKTEKEKTPA